MRREEFREPREPREYRKSRLPVILPILFAMLLLLGFGFYKLYLVNPTRIVADAVTKGNHALNEGNYIEADSWFQKALMKKPQSYEALMGQAQCSGFLGEERKLTEGISVMWQLAQNGQLTQPEKEKLVQFTIGARGFIPAESYVTILETGFAVTQNDSLKEMLREQYIVIAEHLFAEGNYMDARDVLIKAQEGYPEDEDLRIAINRVEGRVQEMELATTETKALKKAMQSFVEASETGDSKVIREALMEEGFLAALQELHGKYYSENLNAYFTRQGDAVYLYYGPIQDGYKEGEGHFYYYDNEGNVVDYKATFVKDVPEGEITIESVKYIAHKKKGGKDMAQMEAYVTQTITVVHGIYHGTFIEHGEILADREEDCYSYDTSFEIRMGYESPLKEVPVEIAPYLRKNEKIVSVTEIERNDYYWGAYTSMIWNYYLPNRLSVRGIAVPFTPAEKGYRPLIFVEKP